MREIEQERPENYEYAIAGDESRNSVLKDMRAMISRWDNKTAEFKRAGYDVIHSITKNDRGKTTDYYILKGPDGYSVQENGKTIISARSRDDCAKEAYLKGIIGYFTRVEIGKGKAAAERAKKDPKIQKLLKEHGQSGF